MRAYDPGKDPLSTDKWMLPERPSQSGISPQRPPSDLEDIPAPRARDLKVVVTMFILLMTALAFLLVSWFDWPGLLAGP